MIWLQFLICAAIIVFAGIKLCRYGDTIGEITGMGSIWAGTILLATITSLPELIIAVSCVTVVDAPDMAIGDILGSNIFNLMIIVMMDVLHRGPLLVKMERRHILSAGLGLIMAAVIGFSIILSRISPGLPRSAFFGIGIDSWIILLIFIVGIRLIFKLEKSEARTSGKNPVSGQRSSVPLTGLLLKFLTAAAVVVISGFWLGKIGDGLARQTGLGHTFVGSIFLAITSSLPEVVVSITAVRIGNPGMALGNVLGSNMFNATIVFVSDIFFRASPILTRVDLSHVLTALLQIILTGILIIGLIYRSKKSFLYLGWNAFLMLVTYLLGVWLLFKVK